MELVGLGSKGDSYPKQMSGGQQQRVALARALVIKPDILLLDEPLSNLDAKLREEMQLELRRIQRELGTTTILVTHDQHEALALSDRIVVMNAGKVEQLGTPFAVYEQPASAFVASFLGRCNSLSGEGRDGVLNVGGWRIPCTDVPAGAVTISVRPEKIRLVGPEQPSLPGRIVTRVFQGVHWLIGVDTAAGEAIVVRQNDGTEPPREGEPVGLIWRSDDAAIRLAGADRV
jgi:putative spermidine/putrescine transport system ATP-binding protein